MTIIPLSEGSYTVDNTKVFVPFDESQHDLHNRPAGSLLVEIQPFVVVTPKDILLLDTGLGFKNSNGVLQVHQNLQNAGIDPLRVTKVLLSHLHKDHSGGVSKIEDGSGNYSISFPNAAYYVQKKEFDLGMKKGHPSYIIRDFEALQNLRNTVFIDGNGIIDDYIQYEVTGAHSMYHQVFWIRDGEKKIFFGGDDAPQLDQMKHRFVAKYDHDGRKAAQLRRQWWQTGMNEKWIFLFYHDLKNAVWKF